MAKRYTNTTAKVSEGTNRNLHARNTLRVPMLKAKNNEDQPWQSACECT